MAFFFFFKQFFLLTVWFVSRPKALTEKFSTLQRFLKKHNAHVCNIIAKQLQQAHFTCDVKNQLKVFIWVLSVLCLCYNIYLASINCRCFSLSSNCYCWCFNQLYIKQLKIMYNQHMQHSINNDNKPINEKTCFMNSSIWKVPGLIIRALCKTNSMQKHHLILLQTILL